MNPEIWRTAIKATHEEAQVTSLGPWPGNDVLGVALPSVRALHRKVFIRAGHCSVEATVLDVGPWCEDDDEYVFGGSRPRAELLRGQIMSTTKNGKVRPTVPDGKGGFKPAPGSNGAGIDLFPATAQMLKIPIGKNLLVDWKFI